MSHRLLCSVILAFTLIGCSTQAKWTYPLRSSDLYRAPAKVSDLTIAVFPFREDRPVPNRSATIGLYLLPLMPFGWMNYERPEAARRFNTIAEYQLQMDEDFGKAATRSFEESRLFKRVYFTFGGEISEADLILRGTARRTLYHGKLISYGLSIVGPNLWILGLPATTSTNSLDITLSLTDKENHELWSYSFADEETIVQGYFYNWGDDATNFAVLFGKGMNAALQDLERELPNIQAKLHSKETEQLQAE